MSLHPNQDALLGNTAKYSAPPPPGVSTDQGQEGRLSARLRRYEALSQARQTLSARARLTKAKYAGDVYRTVDCRFVSHGAYVAVQTSLQYRTAHYRGLVTCGSVWACPVCSAVIQERRREEITQAMQWAKLHGLHAHLVTFTFPHYAHNQLKLLLAQQAAAYVYLRKQSSYRKLKERIGYQGMIRSLEVTHGGNGFHPHTHELWFTTERGNAWALRLAELWERAAIKVKLLRPCNAEQVHAFRLHALDVIQEVDSGAYLAKLDDSRQWDLSHELSKAASKAGRRSGVHPFRFLTRQEPGDTGLFGVYVDAMKGKRQLHWSPGLKEKIGLKELTDEALADEARDPAAVLGLLNPDEWKLIRGNDAQAEVLNAAETGGWPAVLALVSELRGPQ
jgi:hypothetical protein